jgi:hypothetical protein
MKCKEEKRKREQGKFLSTKDYINNYTAIPKVALRQRNSLLEANMSE